VFRPRGRLVRARCVRMGKIPGAATLFRTISVVASIWMMSLPALGQNGLAVAHFSSLELFADNSTGASNHRALSKAVQELNELTEQGVPIRFVIVTGTLGAQHISHGNPSSALGCGSNAGLPGEQPKWVTSARELADVIQVSKIPFWFFLPGRGDRLSPCSDKLFVFHNLLVEARRQSATRRGPQILDLSVQSSPTVDHLDVLGLDSSGFDGEHPSVLGKLLHLEAEVRASPNPQILIAASWPRVGDPYPPVSGQFQQGWPLGAREQAIWSDIIQNPHVRLVLSGDWQISDESPFRDFHGLFSQGYSSADVTKLYVAPPLGAKVSSTEGTISRGFEVLRFTATGRVTRTLYWLDSETFRSDPPVEFNQLISLGDAFERAGRLGEAEAAYRRAFDLKGAPDRELALRDLKRVLNNWGLLEWWRRNRRTFLLWFILGGLALIGLWMTSAIWHRKRRLKVYSLDAPDGADLPATHLERIAEYLVGRMRFYAGKAGPIDDTKLPFVWLGFAEDFGSTLEKLLPGPQGAISTWLAGWVFRPDFELRGTLAVSDQTHEIILSLHRRRDHIRSWEASVPKNQTHSTLKDLVYGVLLYIKGEAG
jgi:hypothetical protein